MARKLLMAKFRPGAVSEARRKRMWTIRELMKRAGVGPGTLLNLDRGLLVRVGTARRVAKALGAELSVLLDGEPVLRDVPLGSKEASAA